MCCHFQKKKYKIGSVIKTVVGDDGCTSSTLTCVDNGFKARIDISVQNDFACGKISCNERILCNLTIVGTTTAPVTTTACKLLIICESIFYYLYPIGPFLMWIVNRLSSVSNKVVGQQVVVSRNAL